MSETEVVEPQVDSEAKPADLTPYRASQVINNKLGLEKDDDGAITSQSMYSLYKRSPASHASAEAEAAAGVQLFDGTWFKAYYKSVTSGGPRPSGGTRKRLSQEQVATLAESYDTDEDVEDVDMPEDSETEAESSDLEQALQASLAAQSETTEPEDDEITKLKNSSKNK